VVAVQREFRATYAKYPPTDKTIRAWYKQVTETGCLCNQKSSGCPLTAEDDVKRVRANFGPVFCIVRRNQQELQLRSYRCRRQQCGGFCVSVWCFLVINVCNHGEQYETPCVCYPTNVKGVVIKYFVFLIKSGAVC
jgi:hypothetical protein